MIRLIEVVGSLNVDLVTVTRRIPNAGETLAATSFDTGFGGKGANQAVACARLLEDSPTSTTLVKMVGAVGADEFGQKSLKRLEEEHIDHSGVRSVHDVKTGTTMIIVEEGSGENRILFVPGANHHVTPQDVDLDSGFQDNLVLFQLELPLSTVIAALEKAKSLGKVTILNPAPATPIPHLTYAHIDHLIVNESEASMLSGIPEEKLSVSLEQVADIFIEKGVHYVLVTLGANGVFWKVAGGRSSHVKARSVKAVDTTAAGDTFVGAYAAYLACVMTFPNDLTLKAAIEFANHAAAISVQKHGAQASIPYRNELSSGAGIMRP